MTEKIVSRKKKVFICAGEKSGDLLAASLIKAVKHIEPDWSFCGVTGPEMQKLGCESFETIDALSVMGLTETIKKLPFFLSLKRRVIRYIAENEIDLFIGIDFTEFNLSVEKTLKKKGIKTCHYKSPSVWAWRQGRLKTIRRAVDMMLLLFPFEKDIYQRAHIPATYIGHPLADQIPLNSDSTQARATLAIPADNLVITLLPGSRTQEIKSLLSDFLKAAQLLTKQLGNIQFLLPISGTKHQHFIKNQIQAHPDLSIALLPGKSHLAMQAADLVILASGTATLEAMLFKKPMVVCYRLSTLTYQLLRFLIYIDHYALPNILAKRLLMPELIQNNLTPEKLYETVLIQLKQPKENWLPAFEKIHHELRCNASACAAEAIVNLGTRTK